MKKCIHSILCFSFVICFSYNINGQQTEPIKVIKKSNMTNDDIVPPPPPPPLPPPSHEGFTSYKEVMPRYPGCEDQELNDRDLEKCSKELMLDFIYDNLEYPEEAKIQGVEGNVVIQFTLTEEGSMEDIKLIRDIGCGCGPAAMKVVEKMQSEKTWIPGKQNGKVVPVNYYLPVKFKH